MRAVPGAPPTGALRASNIVPDNVVTNRQESRLGPRSDPSASEGKGRDGPQSFPSPAPYKNRALIGAFLPSGEY